MESKRQRKVEGRGRENEVRKKDEANLIWRGVGDDVQQSHIVLGHTTTATTTTQLFKY